MKEELVMKTKARILFLFALAATSALGQGTILWEESVNGPISNEFGEPTFFGALQDGTNSLMGSVSNGA